MAYLVILTRKKILFVKNLKPLKRFGQNYLKDQNILEKIVRLVDPKPDDQIIEIGPGKGALTEKLSNNFTNLTAIEIDKRVTEELTEKFSSVKFIQDDFLKINLDDYFIGKKIRVVGNIPYNLTSPILFKLISHNEIISDTVLMVQFEVAKRMNAVQGTKDYGILSVLLLFFAEVNLAFKVSPNAFFPKPNVDSAVVHIKFSDVPYDKKFQKLFISTVKACFGNRRKMLKNSLRNSIFGEINFENSGIDLTKRAEQLSIKEFIKLTTYISNYADHN